MLDLEDLVGERLMIGLPGPVLRDDDVRRIYLGTDFRLD